VAQAGHINIGGTAIAGKVRVGTSIAGGALVRVEDTTGTGGVYSKSTGNGVYSESSGLVGSLIGGQFIARSTTGRGVIGSATALTGSTRGGIFDSKSTTGVGVYGLSSALSGTGVGVIGSATAATGTAIVAINPNAGTRVELAGPNGAVHIASGTMTKDYGSGNRGAIPIAYGTISDSGTLFDAGTANWSVVKSSVGDYKVTITGENYTFGPYVAVANSTYGGSVSPYSTGGQLGLQIWSDTGTLVDKYVSFVVFKSIPGALYPPTPNHGFKDDFVWAKKRPADFAKYKIACRRAEKLAMANTTPPVNP